MDHDSFAPLMTHPLTDTLTDPLWIYHMLLDQPYSLLVYKSAIWVPCSPSSDLVTILYTPCNNQLDSHCSFLESLRALFTEHPLSTWSFQKVPLSAALPPPS